MARSVTEYRCLLISPSDVAVERDALTEMVIRWDAQIGSALGARVELVRWELHSVPDMAGEPQSVLNTQIVDDCDLGIALFWSRVGMRTKEHESGSLEEIERLLKRGCKVMVYFKNAPIPQDKLDTKQFERLKNVKDSLMQRGIVGNFDDIADLKQQIQLHLTKTIVELLSNERSDVEPPVAPSSPVLPKPDMKVRVQVGFATGYRRQMIDVLTIRVENHSPMTVYLRNVTIQLKDNRMLLPPRDSLTGEYQTRRTLHPGESFSFNLTREVFESDGIDLALFDYASVVDDIGRNYDSSPEEFQAAVKAVLHA